MLGIFLAYLQSLITKNKQGIHNKNTEDTCPHDGHFSCSHTNFNHMKINKEGIEKMYRRPIPMLDAFPAHTQSLITLNKQVIHKKNVKETCPYAGCFSCSHA